MYMIIRISVFFIIIFTKSIIIKSIFCEFYFDVVDELKRKCVSSLLHDFSDLQYLIFLKMLVIKKQLKCKDENCVLDKNNHFIYLQI